VTKGEKFYNAYPRSDHSKSKSNLEPFYVGQGPVSNVINLLGLWINKLECFYYGQSKFTASQEEPMLLNFYGHNHFCS